MFPIYPYLNINDLNLDYILKQIGILETEVTQFVSLNAIKYADPIQWNIVQQYEKNTVVIDPLTGTAYISVAPVPSGVALTNTDYWTVVFDLGSFVTRAAQNFTSRWESETTATATFPTNTGEWLVWGDVLYKALTNITAGDTYVVGGNIDHFTIEDLYNTYLNTIATILNMIGDLTDLNTSDTTSIVNAINSVLDDMTTAIGNVDNKVGDLADLNTTDKTSIVNAINEVNTTGGGALALIGDLDDLLTISDDNLVDAINEVYTNTYDLSTHSANTIHVATTGDDTTGDGSAANPFATIQRAYDSIPPIITEEQIIYIHNGLYNTTTHNNDPRPAVLYGEGKNNFMKSYAVTEGGVRTIHAGITIIGEDVDNVIIETNGDTLPYGIYNHCGILAVNRITIRAKTGVTISEAGIVSNGATSYVHMNNVKIDGQNNSNYGAYAESLAMLEIVTGCVIENCRTNLWIYSGSVCACSELTIGAAVVRGLSIEGHIAIYQDSVINSEIYVLNGGIIFMSAYDSGHNNEVNGVVKIENGTAILIYTDFHNTVDAVDSTIKINNCSADHRLDLSRTKGTIHSTNINANHTYGIRCLQSDIQISGTNTITSLQNGIGLLNHSTCLLYTGTTTITSPYAIGMYSCSFYSGVTASLNATGTKTNRSYPANDFTDYVNNQMTYFEEL